MGSLRKLIFLGLVLGLMLSPTAKACFDGSCDSWGGLFNTGGYNLYGFGSDIYSLGGYSSGYDSWGGGCGNIYSGCGGGYDSAGMYGSDWGSLGGGFSLDIGISIYPLTDFSSYGYSDYSSLYNSCDIGCSVGYCDGSAYPYTGNYMNNNPWSSTPSYWDYPYTSYDPYQYYSQNPYSYPTNYGNIPRDPYGPPPSIPPYGGCDNIIVMCPTGPVGWPSQPQPVPPYYGGLPRDNGYPNPGYPYPEYPSYPPTHNNPSYPPVTYPGYPPVTYPPVSPPGTTYPPVTYPPVSPPVGNPTTPPGSNPGSPSFGPSVDPRPPVRNTLPRG